MQHSFPAQINQFKAEIVCLNEASVNKVNMKVGHGSNAFKASAKNEGKFATAKIKPAQNSVKTGASVLHASIAAAIAAAAKQDFITLDYCCCCHYDTSGNKKYSCHKV